jgi:hypothetical protein
MRTASNFSKDIDEAWEERFWHRKYDQEIASIEENKGTSRAKLPGAVVAVPGSVLYAHQANQVQALEELEEILFPFPGRSEELPHHLKKLLVDWKVNALYHPSQGPEFPEEHAPCINRAGALVTSGDRHVLPPEYAPSWLLECDPVMYKMERYAYESMVYDHDVEPCERHIPKDGEYYAIKNRVLHKAKPPVTKLPDNANNDNGGNADGNSKSVKGDVPPKPKGKWNYPLDKPPQPYKPPQP